MLIVRICKKVIKLILPEKIIEKFKEEKNKRLRKNFYNLGRYSYSLSPELIKPDTIIGDFVSIASGVQIGPGNHPISFLTTSPFAYHYKSDIEANLDIKEKTFKLTNSKPICIGNDVWIGTNAVIMNGLCIGDGAVIGANAIVTHDVPSYAVVAGIPAKIIKYRFENEIRKRIIESRWWNLPDAVVQSLPLDNIVESLNLIEERRHKIKNSIQVCFVISSCIYPSERPLKNADRRSVFSAQGRIKQTMVTIDSIKEHCKNAFIVLIDNGTINPKEFLMNKVDEYIYIGNNKLCRLAASAKNKSIGEAIMLYKAVDKKLKDYQLIFKISGRYYLNNNFDLAEYDLESFNFLNYCSGKVVTNTDAYRAGSHSTRLYGFPGKKIPVFRRALIKSAIWGMFGKSIETSLPQSLKNERFFYHKRLGLSGKVAVDGSLIDE